MRLCKSHEKQSRVLLYSMVTNTKIKYKQTGKDRERLHKKGEREWKERIIIRLKWLDDVYAMLHLLNRLEKIQKGYTKKEREWKERIIMRLKWLDDV